MSTDVTDHEVMAPQYMGMFDTNAELLEKIRLGESSFLEFKEVKLAGGKVSGPHRNSLADGLAAFANSQGGVFVLGVSDKTHGVIGIPLEHLDTVVEFVRNICMDSIEPALEQVTLDRLHLPSPDGENVAVVKVDVPRSSFVHRSPGGYLHRVADSKRPISPALLARLFGERGQQHVVPFDEQLVPKAGLGDLNTSLWSRFHSPRSDDDDAVFLTKLGMAVSDEEGVARPTVAGVLMASDDPRRWLPNAYVQAVAYRGNDIHVESPHTAYQLDALDATGPLDRQVVDACRFVARNMKTAAFKHLGRTDLPQYDLQAVFEALVNAVAHRDYSVHGSKVRLRLFDNRLELYSPGAIPNSLTVESLRYRQSARNDAVCSLLARCPIPDEPWLATPRRHMMERRGEGMPIILDNSMALSGKEPEIELFDNAELRLTIYAAQADSGRLS